MIHRPFDLTLSIKIFIITTFLILQSFASYAQEKDLIINAENISYEKEMNLIEATGNVKATYIDLEVVAPHLIYNTKEREIYADRGFTLFRNGQRIDGKVIHYGIDTKIGSAEGINMSFQGVYLKGSYIKLKPKEIYLYDASFTSCDLPKPHYHLSGRDLHLYPEIGWVVAYWGFFWLHGIPTLPVPTYIYIFGPGKRRRNIAPVPEIGSNDEDGGYIHERIDWHRGKDLYGKVTLSYASKKGIGGGVDGNYILNDQNEINARVYTLGKDGLWGGITYIYSFGPEVSGTEELIPSFVSGIRLRKYELEMNISARERINYERIYLLPEITFRSNKDKLFHPSLMYSFEISTAAVSEESTGANTGKSAFKSTLSHALDLGFLGKLHSGIDLYYRWYGLQPLKWLQILEKFDLKKQWNPIIQTGIGYSHFIMNDGNSPFVFEMYRFSPLDEVRGNIFFTFGETGFGINTFYDYPSWEPKDIDYVLSIGVHCYDIIITYRALRKEFALGMSLFTQ